MYYLPTSCLVFFFIFSLFYPLPCSSSKLESCDETLFKCGNITVGFPFWGGDRHKYCGHPSLGLHCNINTISIFISDQEFNVLEINQASNTLRLARTDHLGSFCSSNFANTTLPPDIFELSPTYKSVTVFHHCNSFPPYPWSYPCICPEKGLISVSENPERHITCGESFTVNLPTSLVPEEKVFNLTHLESALREGFEVTVRIDIKTCEECLSSHGRCGFEEFSSLGVTCDPLDPPTDDLHIRCSAPFSCGDQTDLFYPFWIPGREECGHPEFKLECNGNVAEVSISSVKFRILEANRGSRVIRLARSDYMSGFCPQNPLNMPFSQSVLQLDPGTEPLTIYYGCPEYSISTYVGQFDCEYENNYYVTRNLSSPQLEGISTLLNKLKGFCRRNVSIPTSKTALDTLEKSPNSENLEKALEDGFKLGLNQECSKCMDSEGACGYDKNSRGSICYCVDKQHDRTCGSRKKSVSTGAIAGIVVMVMVVVMATVGLFCLIRCRTKTSDALRQQNLKALIPLKHYSYAQIKRITKSFAEVVGKGGFGIVYKGTLSDGRLVAVKVLKDSKGNSEDFINEVASMSKTSHVNIVSLLGFCSEGSKRAILYDFVENGSLDKFMSRNISMNMDWTALYGIALGVARGLEYLHFGCKTRIVHFDIKPSNVLVDKNLCPKVSDFGLAKLCEKKESIMSLLDTRGTIGYIAPEMISRVYGSVSHKSDVYSYGMLVLEMIGARNKPSTENSASNPSSMYFPEWIYRDLEKGDGDRPIENGISSEEEEISKKMTLVGLWCIQSSPLNRPPMNRVVEMMEGSLEALEVPPRPVLQQIPATPFQESSLLSEDTSVYT